MGIFKSKEEIEQRVQNEAQKEVGMFLVDGEEMEKTFALIEDFFVLTNKRIIFVDKKFTSSKKGIYTIPYSKITAISLSKGGFMNFSKEIEITFGSKTIEIKMYFDEHVVDCYKRLSSKIL